jgi:hypothetical protein
MTLAALIWLIVVLYKFRPAKINQPVTPQHLPPADLTVPEAATWYAKNPFYNRTTPAAILLHLAMQGFIQIRQAKTKHIGRKIYELRLLKPLAEALNEDDKEALASIFRDSNPGATVNTDKRGGCLNTLIIVVTGRLGSEGDFYYSKVSRALTVIFSAIVPFVVAGVIYIALGPSLLALILILPVSIALASGFLFNPISADGVKAKNYPEGMKMFMTLSEIERLEIIRTAPGDAPINIEDSGQIIALYERLLPYATIFNMAEDWAKVLQAYYERDRQTPNWLVDENKLAIKTPEFADAIGAFSKNHSVIDMLLFYPTGNLG